MNKNEAVTAPVHRTETLPNGCDLSHEISVLAGVRANPQLADP